MAGWVCPHNGIEDYSTEMCLFIMIVVEYTIILIQTLPTNA